MKSVSSFSSIDICILHQTKKWFSFFRRLVKLRCCKVGVIEQKRFPHFYKQICHNSFFKQFFHIPYHNFNLKYKNNLVCALLVIIFVGNNSANYWQYWIKHFIVYECNSLYMYILTISWNCGYHINFSCIKLNTVNGSSFNPFHYSKLIKPSYSLSPQKMSQERLIWDQKLMSEYSLTYADILRNDK